MFTFWAQIIIVSFIFLGNQRSSGNASTAAFLLETPLSNESEKRGFLLRTTNEEEEGSVQHWDCQPESNYIQEQISLTTQMLHEGNQAVNKQDPLSADAITVLVLGKAGSGKTSLVQFLTDNPKLSSKIVDVETGEFIIEDGEKIGTSATESFTMYPELVNFNSTINFCDSPGFHDSRSSAHEIVSMYLMKSVTNRFRNTKILLLENYSSLQYGVSKDNFIDTLENLNDFIVDIDKYKDHIALIASKTPFTYRMAATDEGKVVPEIVTEEMHIESIVKYLNHTEKSLEQKLNQRIVSKNKKDVYQKMIRLLKSLQTKDENGKVTRINIFRRPYKPGPLKTLSLLEKNRNSLLDTVMSLGTIGVENNDFDFTLSNEAKLYLECLLKLTNENYENKINKMAYKLNEYIAHKTQNYTSFHQVLSDLNSFHIALKQLSQKLDETKNYNEFFENIQSFMSDKIPSQYYVHSNSTIMNVLDIYEEILIRFIDTRKLFTPSTWTMPIRQLIKSTENKLEWYEALDKFINGLSDYEIQKNKTELYNRVFNYDNNNDFKTRNYDLIMFFMQVTGGNLNQYIDTQTDEEKTSEIELIARSFLQKSNVTCDANGRLVVKGFLIRLGEIDLENLVRLHCNNGTILKEVAFMAVNMMILDVDTDDFFKGVDLFIAAPEWRVIGQSKKRVVLSGRSGPRITDNNPYLANGKDGKPGLPGENSGSFFGIGLNFLNGKNLRVELNGGDGGPGTDGEKGHRGLDGRNAGEKIKSGNFDRYFKFTKGISHYSRHSDNLNEYLMYDGDEGVEKDFVLEESRTCQGNYCETHIVRSEIQVIMEEGDCGGLGRPGGLGGGPGIGGSAGEQILIALNDPSEVQFEMKNGSMGSPGNLGKFGDYGSDGVGIICIHLVGLVDGKCVFKYGHYFNRTVFWKCESTNTPPPTCNRTFNYYQNINNHTNISIKQPTPRKSTDFSYNLLDYAVLLKTHVNHTIFNKIITDFEKAIQKKFSYSLNEMGLMYFSTFKIFE